MLRVESVSKQYKSGKKALESVDFHIKKNEFVALLGQNGAGKTTLINILGGNVRKSSGKVWVAGKDIDCDELFTKRSLGIVPQEISIDFNFTVMEILKFQAGYFGCRWDPVYAEYLLERLALTDKKDVKGRYLSGGMKRRLLIAKALIHQPEIIILDEPTAGVDIELRHALYTFLEELKSEGKTIILTTHYLEEAERLCDRIIMIHQGAVVADDSKIALMNRFASQDTLQIQTHPKAILAETKFKVERVQDQLRIHYPREELATVMSYLLTQPVYLETLVLEQSNLEEVFLTLTRGGKHETDL